MPEPIRLYDGSGHVITEMHPSFKERLREFGYNDDPTRRGRAKPISQTGSESWSRQRDRYKAMADAREQALYDWIGGPLARVVLYTVGRLHCNSQTGEPEVDEAYDNFFHGWCGDELAEDGSTRCDLSGRHRFIKMVQMAFLSFLVDGDHGFVEVDPAVTGEFCLQHVEADRIGKPHDGNTDEDTIGGVKIDVQTGRPFEFRVHRRTRTGDYVDPQDVPAGSFIHVFDPTRSDEYRGTTKLLPILNDMRDLREWIEAEKIAAKVQSQWAALIGTRDPFNNTGPGAWDGTTDAGTPSQTAAWGKILKMAEGENFSMLAPSSRPSGAFMSFVQMIIRKMAASLALSYGFLWNLGELGGVSQRIEVQSDQRRIQYWQSLLKNIILNRVRNKVIAQGIAQGILPPHPNWMKCDWQFGAWLSTDVGYEMDSDIAGVQAGILKVSDVIGKYGDRPREVFMANAATANEAIMAGQQNALPAEAFAGGIYPNLTNLKASFSVPTPLPPPEPGSFDAIGDKGVKQLTEILTAVGEGKMDRDSAIQTLMHVFGMDKGTAEKIVPEEPSEEQLNRDAGLTPEGKPAQVVGQGGGKPGAAAKPKPAKSAAKPAKG